MKYGLSVFNPAGTQLLHIVAYKEKPNHIQEAELRTSLRNDLNITEVSNLLIKKSTDDELNQMIESMKGYE